MTKRHPKPTDLENAGRLVRKAAMVIRDRGWTQGTLGGPSQGMCIMGAIQFARNGSVMRADDVTEYAGGALGSWLPREDPWLPGEDPAVRWTMGWNDTSGRTREEVIQYMNKFADEVDPQRS